MPKFTKRETSSTGQFVVSASRAKSSKTVLKNFRMPEARARQVEKLHRDTGVTQSSIILHAFEIGFDQTIEDLENWDGS